MRVTFCVIALLVLAGGGLLATDPLTQANEAFRAGQYAKAAELFQVAAELEGRAEQRAEIRVKLAWTHFALQQRDRAEAALSAAVQDNPALELAPEYYSDEFLALFARLKTQRAAIAGQILRTVTPETVTALRSRADLAVDPATLETILDELRGLEAAAPPALVPQLLDTRATLLERLGRNQAALETLGRAAALRAALAAPPGTTAIPLETIVEGRRLSASGQPHDAAALMRGVLAVQPSCGPALEVLGEAYLAAGRYDEAHAALRAAILADQRADLFLTLGEVELRRGNLAGAREAFRRATELAPGNERALASLGLLAAGSGDAGTARTTLDAALAANATLFEALVVRAQIALADGEPAAAVRHLQRALQVRPDEPWALGWLGRAVLAQGDAATAAELLRRAEREGAQFAVAHAEALRRLGRCDQALDLLAPHLATPDGGLVAALCHLDRHQPAEAAAVLAPLVARTPADGRLRYLNAVVLAAQGSASEALAELGRATALAGCPSSAAQSAANLEGVLAAEALISAALRPPPPPTRP